MYAAEALLDAVDVQLLQVDVAVPTLEKPAAPVQATAAR